MHDGLTEQKSHENVRKDTIVDASLALLELLGESMTVEQLFAGMPYSQGTVSEGLLSRALVKSDFRSEWSRHRSVDALPIPCAIRLNNGCFAAVMSRSESGYYVRGLTGSQSLNLMTGKHLDGVFAGQCFTISPTPRRLNKAHNIDVASGHWFWSVLFAQRNKLFDIVVASFVANLIAVSVSLFSLQVYDRVIPGKSEATLWVLFVGAVVAILFEMCLRTARATLVDRTGKETELLISREIFSRAAGMKLDSRPAQPGVLINMIREFGAVREFFTTAAVGVVADLPFTLVFLALIYAIAGSVVWVVLAGGLLMLVPSLLVQKTLARLSREGMGGMAASSRLLTETLYNLESVRTARAEPAFQQKWEEINLVNSLQTTKQRAINAMLTFWAGGVQQLTFVSSVVAGVYMVFAGEFTIGSMIAVSILSGRALGPVSQLASIILRWQNMRVALDGLDLVMAAQQEREPEKQYLNRPSLTGDIVVDQAAFRHNGMEHDSLNVQRLRIRPGSNIALLGNNGSGKSTLLRLLAGLYHTTAGEISIDGVDIRQIDPAQLRVNIGYLPQEVRLFQGTLRSNLQLDGRNYSDAALYNAIQFVGLGDFVGGHPNGLDAEVLDGGEGLSTGQKQSIGLARLFLQDPTIVLLDEPTASFDQQLEEQIVERLGAWLEGKTAVVATHRLSILRKIDRIAVMQKGHVIFEGERDAVLKKLNEAGAT